MSSIPIWRFTRNPYAKKLHDTLDRIGITLSRFDEFVHRDLEDRPIRSVPDTIRLDVQRAAEVDERPEASFEKAEPDDRVILAWARSSDASTDTDADAKTDERAGPTDVEEELVGWVFLSDRPVYESSLRQHVALEGAYLWRLYIDPAHRQRGIATGLIDLSMAAARDAFDAPSIHALVASDNRPSQWVFEANGFDRRRTVSYYRVFGFEHRAPSLAPA